MVSLAFLILMALACFVIPPLMDEARNQPGPATFAPPGTADSGLPNFLGTDANGRDVLYRVLGGGRVSLIVGFAAAAISLFIGTLVGMVAGFYGGKVDHFLMRTVDILYANPRVLFAMVAISTLQQPMQDALAGMRAWAESHQWAAGKEWAESMLPYSRTLILVLCLGLIEWLTMARIVRGQVLVLREQQFVAAARCLGQTRWRIMTRHLLPNLWTVILTYLTLTVPIVIMDESFLSFLGLGIDEPAPSWGKLLKDGAAAVNPLVSRWWLLAFPALAMSATLLALNFLGDSLRDALDVR